MRAKFDQSSFELLGKMIDPPAPPPVVGDRYWAPSLTPAQEKLFASIAKYILCWGPKGGAKTYGGVEKLVKHCYENVNAFALILVRVQNMAVKGGAWDKLINEVLPKWKDGLGVVDSGVKTDANHCQYIWISNQHGGWSMITVMSCPHANQLRQRIRGVEPSIVLVDELTSCDSVEYFESVAAQLGRRPLIKGVQQFIGACNPEGPSHWVYKKWFVEPFNDDTGEKNKDYEDIFFPREENRANLQEGYFEHLDSVYGKNATEAARMIGGEWVDQPSGEGLFRELFNPTVHVRPLDENLKPHQKEWLTPHPDHAFIIGLDPGAAYNAFVFWQWLPLDGKMRWVCFDEVVTIRKRIKYSDLVPIVMRRVRFWRDEIGKETPMVWVADNSAFNQYRAAQGSYDALEIERVYDSMRAKYRLEPIKIKRPPQFQGSVEARIRIMQTALAQDEIIVSSRCTYMQKMLLRLESEKQKDGAPFDPKLSMTPRRSDHLHVFDAATYPMLTASISPSQLQPSNDSSQRLITVAA